MADCLNHVLRTPHPPHKYHILGSHEQGDCPGIENPHTFPKKEGGYTFLGPDCVLDPKEEVITHKEINYYKPCDKPVLIEVNEWTTNPTSLCIKRVGHAAPQHEDFFGNVNAPLGAENG